MSPLFRALLLAAAFAAPALAAPPVAGDARADVAAAFLRGEEGPDPAAIAGTDACAQETKILAQGLRDLRRGSTMERVTAFAEALDPVTRPLPPAEVIALYLRGSAAAAAAPPDRGELDRAARARERALALMAPRAAFGSGLAVETETPAPWAAPAKAAPPAYSGSIRAAPVFASAERGAVIVPLNAQARTEVASIDARLDEYGRRRAAARERGDRLTAAGIGAVSAAGWVLRETWRGVAALTGRDSAENIVRTIFYQPDAVLDYGRRQSALPSFADEPGACAAGTALNLFVLSLETLPGSKAVSSSVHSAYRGLVRDSHVAQHDLHAAEAELARAPSPETRARFEEARLKLDEARKHMVEYRLAYALDHEFHGAVKSRSMAGAEVEVLNGRFVAEGGSPPFHTGVAVYEVETTKAIELCRTHRASDLKALRSAGHANGDWFIPCATLAHYDQAHLRDLLALPDTNATEFVARFTVPAGTKFYVGAAGAIRGETASRVERMYTDAEGRAIGGGGNGGKLQFFLDPHINGPQVADASREALSAHHQDVRAAILYRDSVPVPRELPPGVLPAH